MGGNRSRAMASTEAGMDIEGVTGRWRELAGHVAERATVSQGRDANGLEEQLMPMESTMKTIEILNLAEKNRYSVNSIVNAFTILCTIFESDTSLSLSQLFTESAISKNNTFRILSTLENIGVVEKDKQGNYCIGPSTLVGAYKMLSKFSSMEIDRIAMVDLSKSIDEAVYLTKKIKGSETFIDMVDCSRTVKAKSFVGRAFAGPKLNTTSGQSGNVEVIQGVTVCIGALDPDITTVSIEIASYGGQATGSLVVLAPSFRLPLATIKAEVIPALLETVKLIPQVRASTNRPEAPSAVAPRRPKREKFKAPGIKNNARGQVKVKTDNAAVPGLSLRNGPMF